MADAASGGQGAGHGQRGGKRKNRRSKGKGSQSPRQEDQAQQKGGNSPRQDKAVPPTGESEGKLHLAASQAEQRKNITEGPSTEVTPTMPAELKTTGKAPPRGETKGGEKVVEPSQNQGTAEPSSQGAQGGEGVPQKTKAQLKAERRALQEAQRAAKLAQQSDPTLKKKGGPGGPGGEAVPKKQEHQVPKQTASKQTAPKQSTSTEHRVSDKVRVDDPKAMKRLARNLEKHQIPQRTVVQKKVGLFNHLHQYEREVSLTKDISFASGAIHPAILKLGLQYAEGIICGSNARCIALLGALKQLITDYHTPPQKELARDLEAKIKPCISFLNQCRPLSISMGNAIKITKHHITHIPQGMSDKEAKSKLCEYIDDFHYKEIEMADVAISQEASKKIRDRDVILVYAYSSLIKKVLCEAFTNGKKFRVIVVDGRPKLEGREMLRKLVQHGIKCSYVLINAASYVMNEVTKVLLGAHALLANGCVMSRVGSSQVALVAKSYNVPVLVCCETYKFCERVQTDSFVFNELGDPDDLVQIDKPEAPLCDWRDIKCLSLLNLVYDVTPPELVTMVITELGTVPCTSVPVVLRVKQAEREEVQS